MNLFEAIILGVIQGFTEFLPISSTGHLTVAGKLMRFISNPEHWTAFIAVIQLGTLISTLIYFRKDIRNIVGDFFRDNFTARKNFKQQGENSKMGWMLIISSIPIAIIGLSLRPVIEGPITKNLYVISASLILLAVVLAYAEKTAKLKKEIKDLTVKDSVIIGIAQSFALIPGSSRSGTTITGGLFVGLKREYAARFSFLLSIPAVFASGMLELIETLKYIQGTLIINLFIATIVSGICGYIAIDFLLRYLRNNTTFLFIYYRVAAGVIILILLFTQIIQ